VREAKGGSRAKRATNERIKKVNFRTRKRDEREGWGGGGKVREGGPRELFSGCCVRKMPERYATPPGVVDGA